MNIDPTKPWISKDTEEFIKEATPDVAELVLDIAVDSLDSTPDLIDVIAGVVGAIFDAAS